VPIINDTVDEPNETVSITLSNLVAATAGSGALTIVDNDLTPTALTVKAVKTPKLVKAKGLLETATSGISVKVTLFKKKGARYVRVSSKTVAVKRLMDRDGDGKSDGQYVASFTRPAKGSYRFTVVFAGTSQLKKSTKKLNFTL
jgi:hypothetical protein